MQWNCSGEIACPAPGFGFPEADGEACCRKVLCDLNVQGDEPIGILDAKCSIQISQVGNTDVTDRVPVLTESLCFARSEEREIRLIVGVGPGHELNVGTVAIGEASIPGITEFVVAPGPLFLAGSNVVVCIGDGSGAATMIVATEEVST